MKEKTTKQSILIIDDTPAQLLTFGRILSSQYDVKIAKTGSKGIELASMYNIDLILLDLFMPDMSGFEVLKRLKASEDTKDIPVIFITGSVSNEDEAEGLALGAVDFIRKPVTKVVVRLRVAIHLRLIAQMKFIQGISLTDGLTGINNRRSFDQTIKSIWNLARRTNDMFSMLMIDIDKFKVFNEKYGHLNGDICLKTVATTMRDTLERDSDSVFRWGGEEFVIILPNTDIEGAMLVAERVRSSIAATLIVLEDETASVTVSIGVGSIAPDHSEFDKAVLDFSTTVNKALFRAKEGGRNRVEKAE